MTDTELIKSLINYDGGNIVKAALQAKFGKDAADKYTLESLLETKTLNKKDFSNVENQPLPITLPDDLKNAVKVSITSPVQSAQSSQTSTQKTQLSDKALDGQLKIKQVLGNDFITECEKTLSGNNLNSFYEEIAGNSDIGMITECTDYINTLFTGKRCVKYDKVPRGGDTIKSIYQKYINKQSSQTSKTTSHYKNLTATVTICPNINTNFSIHRKSETSYNERVHLWNIRDHENARWILNLDSNGVCYFTNSKYNTDHLNAFGGAFSVEEALGTWRSSQTPGANEKFNLVAVDNDTFRIQASWDKNFYFYICSNTPSNGLEMVVTSDAIAASNTSTIAQAKFKLYDVDKKRFLTQSDLSTTTSSTTTLSDKAKLGRQKVVNMYRAPDGENLAKSYDAVLSICQQNKFYEDVYNYSSGFISWSKVCEMGDKAKTYSCESFTAITDLEQKTEFGNVKEKFYDLVNQTGAKSDIIDLKDTEKTHVQKAFEIKADFKKLGKEYIYDYFKHSSPTTGILKIMKEAYDSKDFTIQDGYLSQCKAIYKHPYTASKYSEKTGDSIQAADAIASAKNRIDCDYSDMIVGLSRLIDKYRKEGKVSKQAATGLFFEGDKLRSWCVNSFLLHKLIRDEFKDIDTYVPKLGKDSKINITPVSTTKTTSDAIPADIKLSEAETSKYVTYHSCNINNWTYPLIPVAIKKNSNGEYVLYVEEQTSEIVYSPSNVLFTSDKTPKTYNTTFGNKDINKSIGDSKAGAKLVKAQTKPSCDEVVLWTTNYRGCDCTGNGKESDVRLWAPIKGTFCAGGSDGKMGEGKGNTHTVYGGVISYTDILGTVKYDFGFNNNSFIKSKLTNESYKECTYSPDNFWYNAEMKNKNMVKTDIDTLIAANNPNAKSYHDGTCDSQCHHWGNRETTVVPKVNFSDALSIFNTELGKSEFHSTTNSIWYKGYNFYFDSTATTVNEIKPTNNPFLASGSVFINSNTAPGSPYAANFMNVSEDIMRVDDRIAFMYKLYLITYMDKIAQQLTVDLNEMFKLHPELLIPSRLKGYLTYTTARTGGNGLYTNIESPVCPGFIHVDKPLLLPHEYYISSNSLKFNRATTTQGYQIVGYDEPNDRVGFDSIFTDVGKRFSTIGSGQIPALVIPNQSNPINYLTERNLLKVVPVDESDLQNFGENGIGLVFMTRPLSLNSVYTSDAELDTALKASNARGSINIKAPIVKVNETSTDVNFFYSTYGDNIKILEFNKGSYSTGVSEFSLGNNESAILISKNYIKDTITLPSVFRTRYRQNAEITGF